ncbi:MAG: hypothetical protein IK015_04550 [Treponema sp.]|nr:hypothetical protein [Treponema sp.]
MKKRFFLFMVAVAFIAAVLVSCTAQGRYEYEQYQARYKSTYATAVNKLEMEEGNFHVYRRVVFYNVRLGETVFACEGYCHVQIDKDGDVELVIKANDKQYLRHYLGQKKDITYFSEQLEPALIPADRKYRITFNPRLWIPKIEISD